MRRDGFSATQDERGKWFVVQPGGGLVGPYSTEAEAWDWVDQIRETQP